MSKNKTKIVGFVLWMAAVALTCLAAPWYAALDAPWWQTFIGIAGIVAGTTACAIAGALYFKEND